MAGTIEVWGTFSDVCRFEMDWKVCLQAYSLCEIDRKTFVERLLHQQIYRCHIRVCGSGAL